uniref:Uncharacterized protein n=1 Tax=Acrobeloides nanus TaxID=290746 RepID=A0A914E7E2_9BILA
MSATSRGRGRPPKAFVPNLAAAGRRSEKEKVEPNPSTSNGSSSTRGQNQRGVPRGARGGRGRGGRGRPPKDNKNKFVQSDGIFSHGLATNLTPQSIVTRPGEETIVGSVNTSNSTRVKLEIGSVKVESDRCEKISSYEEQWQSDDEGDKEALSELLNGESFISNLKRATQMPIVVPAKDTGQFYTLIDKNVLEESKFNKRMKVSDFVHQLLTNENDSMMLLQIPASLSKIVKEAERSLFGFEPTTSTDASSPSQAIPKSNLETEWDDPPEPEKPKHCLSDFPKSVQIGKMKLRRSGRTTLEIAGQEFDMDEATLSNYFEIATRINTARNTFYHLGEVQQSFLCSYDYQRVFAQHSKAVDGSKESSTQIQKILKKEAPKKRPRPQ